MPICGIPTCIWLYKSLYMAIYASVQNKTACLFKTRHCSCSSLYQNRGIGVAFEQESSLASEQYQGVFEQERRPVFEQT